MHGETAKFYIQLHHYHNELILEQSPGEGNPAQQLAFNFQSHHASM
jgi:hypothetical protein